MVAKQKSLNLKSGAATLANLKDGFSAGTFVPLTRGTAYFVDPTNGDNNASGTSPEKAVADIPTAFDLATANQHDTIFYIAGSSSISLTSQLVWNKNYTHLIGIAAPTFSSQRARIFQDSAATTLSPLINITASGCIFDNLLIFQGVDDAASLLNVQVTGGRNYFHNVHFAGGGHATMAIDNCASLMVNGGEENTFHNCKLGLTTIPLATGGNVLRFDGSAKENEFVDCILGVLIGNAGARLVELVDGSAMDQINWFKNTKFVSNSVNRATTMASAWEIPSLSGQTALVYMDKDCDGLGFTDWDDDNRALLFFAGGTITAGGNTGIAQVSNST